jgi:hypothetical protein
MEQPEQEGATVTIPEIPANPYLGPRTFTAADRRRFFGREQEAASLLARVVSERLLLFYAQSGAGKSSLINARLIPHLREEEGFSVLPVGRVAGPLPPGVDAVENIFLFNLLASLDQSGEHPGRLARLGLVDFLDHMVTDDGLAWRYDPLALAQTELQALEAGVFQPVQNFDLPAEDAGPPARFALVIDQFEEIITGHPDRWRERAGFFRQLDAALQANPNLWVVLSLREDYVAALDPYAPLTFNRLRARFYMERMGVAAALDAIRSPAELGGRPFAPGVAEQLVENLCQVRVPGQEGTVPGQYVEPVQLQVVCYQLWENLSTHAPLSPNGREAGAEGHITFADLAEAGDVDRALTQFYVETLAVALADPAAEGVSERQLRAWFDKELITAAGTRGLVHQGERQTGSLPTDVVRALQRRFLVRGEARGGDMWIELVHDRFVEPIQASNAAWFPVHLSPLQRQAALWNEQGRSSGLLLREAALAEAEARAAVHAEALEQHEEEFLEASRQAQAAAERERRQSRHILMLAVVAGIVAILAIAASGWAWSASQQADDARATAVANATEADLQKQEAERQKVAALDQQEIAETQRAIADQKAREAEEEKQRAEALARRAQAGELAVHAQNALANPLDPSESLPLILAREAVLTTWTVDRTVTANADAALRAAVDAAPPYRMTLPPHRHTEWVTSAAYSPDGRTIVTASGDQTARLWDAATGEHQRTLSGHTDWVTSAAYSPDGRTIVTASDDRTARLWDAATAEQLRTLSGHTDRVRSAAYSPDGRTIVTASADGSARLWDAATGEPLLTLSGHTGGVNSAAYSPDGRTIVTASGDQTARLWDAATGEQLRTLSGHTDWVLSAAYSPDGRTIVTASGDQTARLWIASIDELLAEAARLIQRDPPLLTPHERRSYGLEELP